jgi:Fur family ferric uptake transcriptional regulator
MTHGKLSGQAAPEALQAFETFLRGRGQTLTKPRRLIVATLLQTQTHMAADDLIDALRKAKTAVPKATVYRTLALLRECGLFDAHDFDQGRRLYEPMMGRPHHDHLYCIGCGDVIEFSEDQIEKLQEKIVQRHGFTAVYHSHKIFGYCKPCSAKGLGKGHRHDA